MSNENELLTENQTIEISPPKLPSIFRNYISLIGAVLAVTSLASIILLFFLEWTSSSDQPYLGIMLYILLPGVMLSGMAIFLLGGLWNAGADER